MGPSRASTGPRAGRHRAGFGVLLAICAACSPGDTGPEHPDVVLIVVDTLRADAIADPAGLVATPNIDALAADGIAFREAFAQAPMTLPSHTALFSSRPPLESGVLNNWQTVPDDLPLLAEWLGGHGYSCRAVVSLATLVPREGSAGLSRGFEVYDQDFRWEEGAEGVQRRIDAQLRAWPELQDRAARPIFFFAHFCDPHQPYRDHGDEQVRARVRVDGVAAGEIDLARAPQWKLEQTLAAGRHVVEVEAAQELLVRAAAVRSPSFGELPLEWTQGGLREPAERVRFEVETPEAGRAVLELWMSDVLDLPTDVQRYIGEVEYVDRYVGALLQDLRAAGRYEDSLILFLSDHGEGFGEHGYVGHAHDVHGEAIRVPLIVKPPRGDLEVARRMSRRLAGPVALTDVVPTILEICGEPPLPGQRGRSLLGSAQDPRPVLAEAHAPEAPEDSLCLRDARYAMIYHPADDRFEMYDLRTDAVEQEDVFERSRGERPDWPRRLRALASAASRTTPSGPSGDGARRSALEALGYGGGR